TITVTDNKKQKIDLCRVKSDKNTDYYLKVESHTKELKERSMNEQFRQRFEEGMQKIADSLTKKSGVKQLDKVHERIGKLKGKYPSIARYFDIEIQTAEYVQPKSKSKQRNKNKNGENQNKQEDQENQLIETQKKQLAIAIQWNIKPDVDINARRTKSVIRLSMFKINYSIFLIKNLDSLCTVNFVHI
ncbi:MAG: hypothetical protein WBI06_07205, partial [Paludibacter sp.]